MVSFGSLTVTTSIPFLRVNVEYFLGSLGLLLISAIIFKAKKEITKSIEEIFDVTIENHSLYFYGKKNKK